MVIEAFPPVESADEDGLLALGGDLEIESLLLAYGQGIFPWPMADIPLTWFCPPKRAVLDFKTIHISRSLKRALRTQLPKYRRSINTSFESVIQNCSEAKDRKNATWITEEMKEAYINLHKKGFAHSFEIWNQEKLVGGLYGVLIRGYFSAESMFFLEDNTSKFALLLATEKLKSVGLDWIDIQMMTPHMEHLGAKLISRNAFLKRIEKNQNLDVKIDACQDFRP